MSVYKPRASALGALFGKPKAIIGVIHSRPLPGAPAYEGEEMGSLYDYAVREAAHYAAGGMDGVIVENHGDIPFSKPEDIGPETAASMAVMADRVRRESWYEFSNLVKHERRHTFLNADEPLGPLDDLVWSTRNVLENIAKLISLTREQERVAKTEMDRNE
jgi:hypothetical protein